jgi:transcriptional regulator with XRE-family HTH domain
MLAIAKTFQEIRDTLGINQKQMAELTGVSSGTLSSIESGRRALSQPIKDKLIAGLPLTPELIDKLNTGTDPWVVQEIEGLKQEVKSLRKLILTSLKDKSDKEA